MGPRTMAGSFISNHLMHTGTEERGCQSQGLCPAAGPSLHASGVGGQPRGYSPSPHHLKAYGSVLLPPVFLVQIVLLVIFLHQQGPTGISRSTAPQCKMYELPTCTASRNMMRMKEPTHLLCKHHKTHRKHPRVRNPIL